MHPSGWLSEGWDPLSACLFFGFFKGPEKNSNPHSLFRDFGADKPSPSQLFGLVAEDKFEFKFEGPAGHLAAITPGGYSSSRRQSKIFSFIDLQ